VTRSWLCDPREVASLVTLAAATAADWIALSPPKEAPPASPKLVELRVKGPGSPWLNDTADCC
jgi:hypothetical protein